MAIWDGWRVHIDIGIPVGRLGGSSLSSGRRASHSFSIADMLFSGAAMTRDSSKEVAREGRENRGRCASSGLLHSGPEERFPLRP